MTKIIALLVAGSLLLTLVACGPSAADEELKKQQAVLLAAQAELATANASLVSAQAETERALLKQRIEELQKQIAKLQQEIEFLKSQGTAVVMTAQGQKTWYESQAFLYLAAAVCLCLVAWFLFSRAAREWALTRAIWRHPQIVVTGYPQLTSAVLPAAIEDTVVQRRLPEWAIPAPVLYLVNTGQYEGAVRTALEMEAASNGGHVSGVQRARIRGSLLSYSNTFGAEAKVMAAWKAVVASAEASAA